MKVLGHTKIPGQYGHSDAYIMLITHSELAVALERGYSNELKQLRIDEEINLADIPNQREKVVSATKAMQEAYEKFVEAAPIMSDMARIIGAEKAGTP